MTPTRPRTRSPRATLARRVVGLLVLIAACWATLFAVTSIPAGDPVLIGVSPNDGEVVKSPDDVVLIFDRPVPAGLVTVRMTVPSGEQVVVGRPRNLPDAADTVAVSMPETRFNGPYSVAWSYPSSLLEPISGTFQFSVFASRTPLALPEISTERDPFVVAVHTGARLLGTAAFALGVGVVFVLAVLWPAGVGHKPARRLIKYAWWMLVVATLGTIVSFGGYAARTSLGEAFDPALLWATFASDIGAALLVRLIVLVPITVALGLLLAGTPAETAVGRWLTAGGVLACAAALAVTWSTARPQGPGWLDPLATAGEIVLLLAVAVCVGGPVVLWMMLRGAGDSVLKVAMPRLTRLMPVAGALLLAIAVATAGGWELVALLVLVALAVGTGVAGLVWVRRKATTRGLDLPGKARFRRVAAVATAVAAVALVAAAVSPTGQSQLALTGVPVDGTQQVDVRAVDVQ